VDAGGIVAMGIGVALVVGAAAGVVVVLRRPARPATCGGCGRALGIGWTHCLFCGREVPIGRPRLEFVGGPLAGQVVPLGADVTTIGTVAGNTVVLADPAVSRKHVGIRRVGNRFELADLGSTNGVYVNGHRAASKVLDAGDLIRVGQTEMRFHAG
jgi:hypothetical protein